MGVVEWLSELISISESDSLTIIETCLPLVAGQLMNPEGAQQKLREGIDSLVDKFDSRFTRDQIMTHQAHIVEKADGVIERNGHLEVSRPENLKANLVDLLSKLRHVAENRRAEDALLRNAARQIGMDAVALADMVNELDQDLCRMSFQCSLPRCTKNGAPVVQNIGLSAHRPDLLVNMVRSLGSFVEKPSAFIAIASLVADPETLSALQHESLDVALMQPRLVEVIVILAGLYRYQEACVGVSDEQKDEKRVLDVLLKNSSLTASEVSESVFARSRIPGESDRDRVPDVQDAINKLLGRGLITSIYSVIKSGLVYSANPLLQLAQFMQASKDGEFSEARFQALLREVVTFCRKSCGFES